MVRYRLRDLTANLIRIARGAGKPYEIEVQAAGFREACDEYRAAAGYGLPTHVVHDMLRVRQDPPEGCGWTAEQHTWNMGEESMVAGALQIAASRLMGQRTQETQGHSEMFDGLQLIEEQREQNRRKREALGPKVRKGRVVSSRRGGKLDL